MKLIDVVANTVVVFAASAVMAHASDPTAVYARIERVVLQPSPDAPETVQIWGVFSIAKPHDRNDYLPAARGYLYFKLADRADLARREWADLKQAAGTGQVVSFGSRYQLQAQLRRPNEPAGNPSPYDVNTGVIKVRTNTDYAPIRALLEFKD